MRRQGAKTLLTGIVRRRMAAGQCSMAQTRRVSGNLRPSTRRGAEAEAEAEDILVGQTTTRERVVDTTTARALGLSIPLLLLSHASDMIE